jgi:2-aminoadipate transaminase
VEISLERGRSGGPVYRQIAGKIREGVESGSLLAGARLPAIRALAQQLGVNRDTVALAYDELVSQGIVESAVGRGTFVRSEAASPANAEAFHATLSPLAEKLLEFERARPRFGASADAIPLHSLVPDASLYPADEFRRVLNRVLLDHGPELLLYGGPQGHPELRRALARRFRDHSLELGEDEIVLCHGASQGISLALRLFAQPGDVIALEDPTYTNALAAVSGLGLTAATVPMGADGPDLVALERTLSRPEVKVFYTIPTFHNPMGTTTSLAHRRALLDVATRCGKPVIEDGYEADLRFHGREIPSLAALDRTGCVLHLFSFSKSLFPGARVGAVTARGRLIDALVALKQATDLSDSLPVQAALAEFVRGGGYDRHLARMRRVLRARCEALLDALEREMPEGTHWTHPEGGLQVWVELPERLETSDLLADAVGAGVLFAPGSQFHFDGRPSRCLRLTFAMCGPDALRAGVAKLAAVVRQRQLAEAETRPRSRVHV